MRKGYLWKSGVVLVCLAYLVGCDDPKPEAKLDERSSARREPTPLRPSSVPNAPPPPKPPLQPTAKPAIQPRVEPTRMGQPESEPVAPIYRKGQDITISPVDFVYHPQRHAFKVSFTLTAKSGIQAGPIASVVVVRGQRRRWRSVELAEMAPGETRPVELWLGSGFVLRESRAQLEVKLFSPSFRWLLDKSSAHQQLSYRQLPQARGLVVRDQRDSAEVNPREFVFAAASGGDDRLVLADLSAIRPRTASAPEAGSTGASGPALPSPAPRSTQTGSAFVLTWADVPQATAYRLFCGDRPDFKLSRSEGIDVVSGHRIAGIAAGQTRYCRMAALFEGVQGPASAPLELRNPVVLEQPNLSASAGDRRVLLEWPEVEGALGYRLEYTFESDWPEGRVFSRQIKQPRFEHLDLTNGKTVYYRLYAIGPDGPGPASEPLSAKPDLPKVIEPSLEEQLGGLRLEEFTLIKGSPELTYQIADQEQAQALDLQRAKQLEALDFKAREEMIALYLAEGRGDRIAAALQGQLDEEPANLNLSLSLSKVYAEQGDVKTALDVLNNSLSRISLSARAALNQDLKSDVKEGKSRLGKQSDESFLIEEFAKLGQRLLDEERYDDALSAFQSLYSLAQDYPMIYYRLGLARRGLSQYNQAKEAFIEQSRQEVALQQLISNLKQLSLVVQRRPDLASLDTARKGLREILQTNREAALEADLDDELEELDDLHAQLEAARLAGLPDLWVGVESAAQERKLQPGQGFYANLKAGNRGQKGSGPFRVHYRLEHEANMAFDLQGSDKFEGLESESEELTWNKRLQVPKNVPPGKYRLVVNLELEGDGAEADLANNRSDSEFALGVIEPRADLQLALQESPRSPQLKRGAQFPVQLLVQNRGFLASKPYGVELLLRHESGKSLRLAQSKAFDPLREHQDQQLWEPQVTLPENLAAGEYHLEARLVGVEGEPQAGAKPVRSLLAYRYTPPFIDLGLAFKRQPKDVWVKPGQPFEVELAIENRGNQPSRGVSVAYLLVDREGREHTLEAVDLFKGLDPKAGPQVWQRQLRPSTDLAQGPYRLVARIEGKGVSEDRLVANNRIEAQNPVNVLPLFRRGSLVQARQELGDVLKNQPVDLSASLGLAHLNAEAKERVQLLSNVSAYFDALPLPAQSGLTEALRIDQVPPGPLADARFAFRDFRQLAAKLARQGQTRTALDLYQRLLAIVPNDATTARQLAALQARLGQPTEASRTLSTALALRPHLGLLRDLSELYQAQPRMASYRALQAGWKAWALTGGQQERADQALEQLSPPQPRAKPVRLDIEGLPQSQVVRAGQVLELDLVFEANQSVQQRMDVHLRLDDVSGATIDLHQPLRLDSLPQGRRKFKRQVRLPGYLAPGVYRLSAWTEGAIQAERRSSSRWLTGPANLAIQSFVHHQQGSQVEVGLAWENLGGERAQNSRLQLWHQPEGGEPKMLATAQLPDLEPLGGSRQIRRKYRWDQLPDLAPGRLVAQLTSDASEGILARDNRSVSPNPLGGGEQPVQILGLALRAQRLQPGQPLNLQLRLQGKPKGPAQLWLVGPSGRLSLGRHELAQPKSGAQGSLLYALTPICPELPAGSYRLALDLDRLEWEAEEPLQYGPPKLRIQFVDLSGQDLLPGRDLAIKLAVENNGHSVSAAQPLHLSLLGKKSYDLGQVRLAPVEPGAGPKLVEGRWRLPAEMEQGDYRLSIQGERFVARSRQTMSVQSLLAESPGELEVFLPGQAPQFRWSALEQGQFRLAFSADRSFKKAGTVLRLPWTEASQQSLSKVQLGLIWSLAQNGQRPIYWRVEAKAPRGPELASSSKRLRLRDRP